MYLLFKDIKEADKNIAINSLVNDSTKKPSFFFITGLSALMAAAGLVLNNASVVIGSMLVAPILSPILAVALGISMNDTKLMVRSMKTLVKASFIAIFLSMLVTWFFWNYAVGDINFFAGDYNPEIMSRTTPNLVYFFIAIIAGVTTAFARVKPELNETLPGTAIAIALVPPLATIGVGLATLNLEIISGATSMFVLNAVGIIVSAVVMFSLMNIRTKKKTAEKAAAKADEEQEKIKQEFHEEKIEQEIAEAEKSLDAEVEKPLD